MLFPDGFYLPVAEVAGRIRVSQTCAFERNARQLNDCCDSGTLFAIEVDEDDAKRLPDFCGISTDLTCQVAEYLNGLMVGLGFSYEFSNPRKIGTTTEGELISLRVSRRCDKGLES